MAQQLPANANNGADITPTRYTERRAPQFIGGNTDPSSGNVIPASRADAAAGTVEPPAPPPQQASTKLATISAEEPPKKPGLGEAALATAAPYVGGAVGASLGGQLAGGIPLGEAVKHTTSNIGSVLADPLKSAFGNVPSGAAEPIFPASASVSDAAFGSTTGGAAGTGVATLVTGAALKGGNFVENLGHPEVYNPAIGSAVGYAIGSVLLPGIGGPIGSAIGSLFCHIAGTLIRMEDGTLKAIEQLDFGDRALLGGAVIGAGKVIATDLFEYRGTVVNGRHAVFENGRWVRVQDSPLAKPLQGKALVYPVVTERHLLVCEHYICADLAETDEDIGSQGRLVLLNSMHERNEELRHAEKLLGFDARVAA